MVTDHGLRGVGRPHSTTRFELSAIGLRLFRQNGYRGTSVQHIVDAAGISRSAFFGYFASKAELVWGCQAEQCRELETMLEAAPRDIEPFWYAAAAVVSVFDDIGPEAAATIDDHAVVLAESPELRDVAATLRQRRAAAISGFVVDRLPSRESLALSFAYAVGGVIVASSETFAARGTGNLADEVRRGLDPLWRGFAEAELLVTHA